MNTSKKIIVSILLLLINNTFCLEAPTPPAIQPDTVQETTPPVESLPKAPESNDTSASPVATPTPAEGDNKTPATTSESVTPPPAPEEVPVTQPTNQETATPPTTTENPSTDTTTEKSNDPLVVWQEYLKTLLTKGSFWDAATDKPDSTWLNQVVQNAETVLKKDITQQEELKRSFLDTVENKYTNIEKKISLKSFHETIEYFNKEIDRIITELSPKQETPQPVPTTVEPEKNATEEENSATENANPEEKIEENLEEKPQSEDTSTEQPQDKEDLSDRWKECIDHLKNGGIQQEELDAILEDAYEVSQKLLSAAAAVDVKNYADMLVEEFTQAINARTKPLFPIKNKKSAIAKFKKELNKIIADKEEHSDQPREIFSMTSSKPQRPQGRNGSINNNQNRPANHEEEKEEEKNQVAIPTTPEVQKELPSSITVVSQTTVPSYVKAKKEVESKITAQQQSRLAQKIQYAAAQKALIEKENSQKGIISSVMGTVFGSWWTGTNTLEKTLQEVNKEQDDLILKLIQRIREDGVVIDQNTEHLIKTAYHTLQDKLLSFDINKLWNSQTNEAKNETLMNKWLKEIRSSLKILIKYNIMPVNTIKTVLKDTNPKITVTCYGFIMKELKPYLEKYDNERRGDQAIREYEEKQRKEKEMRQAKEQKEAVNREKEEKIRLLEQEKMDQQNASLDIQKLESEWNELMNEIRTKKPTNDAFNKEMTDKALALTKKEVEKLKTLPNGNNQRMSITEKHIADFNRAIISQQKNQDPSEDNYVNVHQYIDHFDKTVHTLSMGQ